MAGLGIVEIISLLLGIAGFGLHANPKPATPDAALAYAMPDPDIVVHLDVASIVPGNYKILTELPNQPGIKALPDLAKQVREVVANVEGGRGIVKTLTGLDLATDITDATLFVQIVGPDKPNVIATVHGKLTTAVVDKIAKTTGSPVTRFGAAAMILVDPTHAVAVTKDNVLLAGTTQLVKDRLADGWKTPAHGAGTNLGYAAEMVGNHPVFAVAFTLSPVARSLIAAKGKNVLTDLAARHKLASFALYQDGVGWSWIDSTKAGLDAMSQMSDGVVDLLRAAQIAPRGFAKIALGSIDSYRGDKQVDELIRHKDELMKLMTSFTGDGQFKVTRNVDPAKLRLDIRATGKTASEVVPAGVIVPLMVIGFVVERSKAMPVTTTPPMQIPLPGPAPKAPAPQPKAPAPQPHK